MVRLLLAAGGTGGHVYPALAVAEALRHKPPKSANGALSLYFVGTRGGGGFERDLVEQSGIPFEGYQEVWAGPLVGVNPLRALSSAFKMGLGTLQSLVYLLKERPQAVLLTGGWANVPIALGAWLARIPMLIYLPDIEPGSTIKVLSKIANQVAITVADSAQFFRAGQTVVTGYPLREAVLNATRADALTHFKLDAKRPTLLVTGGSRGAQSINLALEAILPDLLQEKIQVIHVTGKLDWERSVSATQNLADRTHYHAFPYLESAEMGLAFAGSDLVLGRSGASCLGEFPYFGAASLLVPYPYAWRYQKVNAEWLVRHGAGILLPDEQMAQDLLPIVRRLLQNPVELEKMKASAHALHQGNGAENIAQALLGLAGETG